MNTEQFEAIKKKIIQQSSPKVYKLEVPWKIIITVDSITKYANRLNLNFKS